MANGSVHVIACGVLSVDIKHIARELGLDVQTTYLPGGLHSNPKELRRRLQETIDEISRLPDVRQIAVGYGVCGRGTVGLHARRVPLAIPRVHDCIALFLGSDEAYRREFSRYPGTYYISAGWVKEKVQPKSAEEQTQSQPCANPVVPAVRVDADYQKLVSKHGEENAEAISHFLSSWQRNYQRAAFIDTGAEAKRDFAVLAQDMAQRFGWKYEELKGSGDLLRKLLTCNTTDKEMLWVPAHHVTVYDPVVRGLEAVPVWKAGREADAGRDEIIEVRTDAPGQGSAARLGLGIDAGGTYTDVVLYEFGGDRVLQKAKALTTKWDYTIGISKALDQLDQQQLADVDLVSISTTLATNAVVEGRGQKVALLIMPPYGLFDDKDIAHRPIAVVAGRMDIDGKVISPIDEAEIRRIARDMVDREQVGAFAVTGYASCANPAHERQIRDILIDETGLPVTCGHEVSGQLGYAVRAQTAALNGRIIPILVSFLEQAKQCLRERGVRAPMMVVRSDGSLMSVETARQRPIETLLSGPAASVAGAQYLARQQNAYVVDVGGTTTDTAMIIGGVVRTTREGAHVGGWQTHVQTLDMRAAGLGGDSTVYMRDGKLAIGPRRVAPVAWLSHQSGGLAQCFDWIERELRKDAPPPDGLLQLYVLNGRPVGSTLNERERRIVDVLSSRPHCHHELCAKTRENWWEVIDLERLERDQIIQRCGLTPTDVLHATGRFERWDAEASRKMLSIFSRVTGLEEKGLAEEILDLFVWELAVEILKKQLDEEVDADTIDKSASTLALLRNWLGGGSAGYQVRIALKYPIIGIGAPIGHFLPQAAKLLETEAIVPEDADVANAIGAITSSVSIVRRVEICPDMHGRYGLRGVEGAPTFAELAEARAEAMRALKAAVSSAALTAGTSHNTITFSVHDNVAPLADGGQLFVSQTIEARLTGRPDLARLG